MPKKASACRCTTHVMARPADAAACRGAAAGCGEAAATWELMGALSSRSTRSAFVPSVGRLNALHNSRSCGLPSLAQLDITTELHCVHCSTSNMYTQRSVVVIVQSARASYYYVHWHACRGRGQQPSHGANNPPFANPTAGPRAQASSSRSSGSRGRASQASDRVRAACGYTRGMAAAS